tara:strand:+ start:1495 stop:2403 length:909 start_codon:yes stop_codon:yes gene_type:complete
MKQPEFDKAGYSIWDMEIYNHALTYPLDKFHPTDIPKYIDEYVDRFPKWIMSSKLNTVKGLDTFPNHVVTHGTSQAMDWWHYWCEWNNLTCKVFRGEYPYHKDLRQGACPFIEEHPLQKGDALLISLPFSGNGGTHERMQEAFDTCDKLGIPVFIDACWFGCCSGLDFDFARDCIQAVAFSTTKSLKTDAWRNGMIFSKHRVGGIQKLYEWRWLSSFNLAIGLHQMEKFSPDYMYTKYSGIYDNVCEKLELKPTNTIFIALGEGEQYKDEKYDRYWRDGAYCRINVRNHLKFFYRLKNKKDN